MATIKNASQRASDKQSRATEAEGRGMAWLIVVRGAVSLAGELEKIARQALKRAAKFLDSGQAGVVARPGGERLQGIDGNACQLRDAGIGEANAGAPPVRFDGLSELDPYHRNLYQQYRDVWRR
jgi:hypothetical protein